jgi:hypothetical protein
VKRSQLQQLVKLVFMQRGLSLTEVSRQAMLDVAALAASEQREADRALVLQSGLILSGAANLDEHLRAAADVKLSAALRIDILPALPSSPDDLEP